MTGDLITNLVTVFLGSGAAFAVAKIAFEYRKDRRERSDAAEYLALRLAFLFEGYAIDCADQASNHRTAIDSHGAAGSVITKVPQLPSLPDSDAYKLLDRSILNDIFDFPQRCRMANDEALAYLDIVGDEEYFAILIEENTLRMGTHAMNIAKNLRISHNLIVRVLQSGEWNVANYFRDELERLDKRKKRRLELEAASAI